MLEALLILVALGFAIQGVAYLTPFRKINARPEILWDVTGFLAAFGVTLFSTRFIEDPGYLWLVAQVWVERLNGWLTDWPLWLVAATNLVLADLLGYWAHRMLHSRPFWPTHAWHHSPRHLYWVAGLRNSPVNTILIALPYTITFALFPIPEAGVLAGSFAVFQILNQHYLHSNLRLPFQRQLEWILVTPRYHFVHHSATRSRTDSNYGFIFSVWDRLFGTYTDPGQVPEDDVLGLDYENSNLRLLIGLPPSPE